MLIFSIVFVIIMKPNLSVLPTFKNRQTNRLFFAFELGIRQRIAVFILCLTGSLGASHAFAGPLAEAHVTKIINDVRVVDPGSGDRTAKLNDLIRGQLGLTTGIKSRSELLFQDNTLTRLGPESYFSFQAGTRDMTLQHGTMLLQVPKGLGGAQIHTASVTASITGTTIMIEYRPQRDIKVLVLEGSLRLSNGRFGDSLLLLPGKMVIMPPNAKRIPDPVTVDLKKILKTSNLVNMQGGKKGEKPLPSIALIEQEVDNQQTAKNDHRLVETNLAIFGKGTNVMLTSPDLLQDIAQRTSVATNNPPTTSATPPTTSGSPPPPTPPPLPSPSVAPTPPPAVTDVGPIPSIKVTDDGKKTEERYGDDGHPISSPLVLNKSQDFSKNGGSGMIDIESKDSVTVNTMLKVSAPNIAKKTGQITINSRKTNGTAISITDSGQLLALLAATDGGGGNIKLSSAGGGIAVNGGTIQADRGTIDIRNTGDSGSINLANATLNASTIKVGALGSNGTLTIGGGTISADKLIRLYAGGSNGMIVFSDNVTLSGNSLKQIAADTVTINNGKVVTVHGPAPANVYTNHPNYTGSGGNGTTTGAFAGQGATTQPLHSAPGF